MVRYLIIYIGFLVSVNALAQSTFASQKPKYISDDKWNKLEVAVEQAQLLPTPKGAGGRNSYFGDSIDVDGNRVIIGSTKILDTGAAYIFEFDGNKWVESQVLIPYDGAKDDYFGSSVSLSGDRAIVGSYGHNSEFNDTGAAYIYDYIDGSWVLSQKINPNIPVPSQRFGYSVSIYEDRTLIGSLNQSVFIFDFIGSEWVETFNLVASDTENFDGYGTAISLSKNRAIVGAKWDEINDDGLEQGSVYIFDFIDGNWQESIKLYADDGSHGDNFGSLVSLTENRVLIGAFNDGDNGYGSGSAYIFDYFEGSWIETTKLLASDGAEHDFFGSSLSLSGDRVLIGAYNNDLDIFDDNSGAAYVFELINGNWAETEKLILTGNTFYDQFGWSVALSENTAFVGANQDSYVDVRSGSVTVYDFVGGSWEEITKLSSPGPKDDLFGYSVSLSGTRALIGAYRDELKNNGTMAGSAYIFDLIADNWVLTSKLTTSDNNDSYFGGSVSLSGDRALIGKRDPFQSQDGFAYIFDLVDGKWIESTKLTASDGFIGDGFGTSVSLFSDRALVGAININDVNDFSGSVYVYDLINGNWVESSKLVASDAMSNGRFGVSLSLANNRALIGSNSGKAYIFEYNNFNWIEATILTPKLNIPGNGFGRSVSLSTNRALVGANYEDGLNYHGAAYIFDYSEGSWSETQKLTTDDTDIQRFGSLVSLIGDRALISTYTGQEISIFGSGSAYIFEFINGDWGEISKITTVEENDKFGASVSLSDEHVLIGAYRSNKAGLDAGTAYVYQFKNDNLFSNGFE